MAEPAACGVCGAPCRAPFRTPVAEQAPDLDFRPGEPARSSLRRSVATCLVCGCSAPDLTRPPGGAAEVVRTEAYRALRDPFERHAMLCKAAGDADGAAWALLRAAWAADDRGVEAVVLRRRAAALWGTGETVADGLRVLDVLRRAGAAVEAAAEVRRLRELELTESDRAVLGFQERLLAEGDVGRHLVSSALRPPARTPHVTHGRGVRGSFWRRVFGG